MAVNFSGMCCTMAMPGLSAGSDSSTCSMAWVPPVELPITTGLLTDRACSRLPAAVAAGRAAGAVLRDGALRRGRERAASSAPASVRGASLPGTASAPAAAWPPRPPRRRPARPAHNGCHRVDSVEQITVGIGDSAICWRRKVRPSMPGISMSSSSTSGRVLRMMGAAISGLGALPISSMSGSPCSRCCIVCRTTAESSTTKTLMATISSSPARPSACERRPGPSAAAAGWRAHAALGGADEEQPARAQALEHAVDHLLLGGGVEVDQHVAQEDHVERPQRLDRLAQVQLAEAHPFAQRRAHLHQAFGRPVAAQAVALQPLRRHVAQPVGRVDRLDGAAQHAVADVGGQDLPVGPDAALLLQVGQQHGAAVGLVAERGGGAPHRQRALRLGAQSPARRSKCAGSRKK
jgi:hypothetical protein